MAKLSLWKTSPKKRRLPVFLSDMHSGHKLGLMNPDVVLLEEAEDGTLVPYTPTLTATQKYLWAAYEEDIAGLAEIAQGDDIVAFFLGDATHGKKYPQHLVSNRLADQIKIGVANFQPLLSLPNVSTLRIAKGTGAHVFDEGSSEILICDQLEERFPGKDIAVTYHGEATIDGVPIDYAHHGPYPGSREWLRGNVARYYLRDIMMRAIMAHKAPPRIVARGHYHSLVTEVLTIRANSTKYVSDLLILPAYCGMGEFAHKATRSLNQITNGMLVAEIIDGELGQIHELVRSLDIRTKEEL